MFKKFYQKQIVQIVIFFIVVFSFLVFASYEVSAKSWNFEKWNVAIQISKDSTFTVRETQTFNFDGHFHWVKRDIAKRRLDKITDIKVFDEDGRELQGHEVEIKENPDQVSIKLNFDLKDTQKTWIFEYKIHGGIGYFANYDELYWNAISSERDVAIKNVEVLVYLPEEVPKEKLRQRLFTGQAGSRSEDKTFSIIDDKTLKFWEENLGPYTNFTIVVSWPKGVVYQPGTLRVDSVPQGATIFIDGEKTPFKTPAILKSMPPYQYIGGGGGSEISEGEHEMVISKFGYEGLLKKVKLLEGKDRSVEFYLVETPVFRLLEYILQGLIILYICLPLIVGMVIYSRWRKFGRDPRAKGTIIAQYEPPDELSPAEMGTLVDEIVNTKDITSTVIDLAYRGYIKIIEAEKKSWFFKGKDYIFKRQKDFYEDKSLKEHEKLILKGLFSPKKEEVALSDLKNKFYTKIPEIEKVLYKRVTKLGYFKKNPQEVRNKYIIIGIVLTFLGGIGTSFIWGISLLISGILVIIFSRVMPAKTRKGVSARWYAFGFRLYLHTAERFRLKALTSETFEKYLSYAMVFGVEKEWAEKFQDIVKEPPSWYEGRAPVAAFSVVNLADSFSSMSQGISRTFTSSPSSSSGFGGGGFSGGGGGGGGSSAG